MCIIIGIINKGWMNYELRIGWPYIQNQEMEQNDPTGIIGNNKFERTSCGLWMVQTTKINQDPRSQRRKRTEPKTETKPPWLEPERAKQDNYIKRNIPHLFVFQTIPKLLVPMYQCLPLFLLFTNSGRSSEIAN